MQCSVFDTRPVFRILFHHYDHLVFVGSIKNKMILFTEKRPNWCGLDDISERRQIVLYNFYSSGLGGSSETSITLVFF